MIKTETANEAKGKTMKLGTILPTSESLAIEDAWHRSRMRENESTARRNLAGLDKRNEQGETRHYDGQNKYAVVTLNGDIKWFERRADGYWYAMKKS